MEFAIEYTKIFTTLAGHLKDVKLELMNERRRSNELAQTVDREVSEKKKLIEEKSMRDRAISQYLSTNEAMTKEIAELKAVNAEHVKNNVELIFTNAELKSVNAELVKNNEQLIASKDSLDAKAKADAKKLSGALLKARRELNDERASNMKCYRELSDYSSRVVQAITEKSELRSQLAKATAERTELSSQLAKVTAEKSELESQLANANSACSWLNSQLVRMTAERTELESRFAHSNSTCSWLNFQLTKTAEELAAAKNRCDLTEQKHAMSVSQPVPGAAFMQYQSFAQVPQQTPPPTKLIIAESIVYPPTMAATNPIANIDFSKILCESQIRSIIETHFPGKYTEEMEGRTRLGLLRLIAMIKRSTSECNRF
jgi:chromosome segregation ATPase